MDNANTIQHYAIQVKFLSEEDGGGFEALFPQLARGVVGYGTSQQEAINDLLDAVPLFLEAIEGLGQTLPLPEGPREWDEFSGKFNIRVPKMVHAQLHRLAEEQGISLNSLVQTILASGTTALAAGCEFGVVKRVNPFAVPTFRWRDEEEPTYDDLRLDDLFVKERVVDTWKMVVNH